jgi:hypothetical protein
MRNNKGDRSGFCSAKEPGGNRREEKNKSEIWRQKSAAREESSVRWISFSEDDVELIAKAQISGGKAAVGNALRSRRGDRSTFDAPAGLTRPLEISQPDRHEFSESICGPVLLHHAFGRRPDVCLSWAR